MSDILNKTIVLVLNRNWQAINIRTPADAFCQMATNAATTLDIELGDGARAEALRPVMWDEWITLPVRDGDHAVRTTRGAIRVPTVIVAVNYARVPKKRPKLCARAIRERDGNFDRLPHRGSRLLNLRHRHRVLQIKNDPIRPRRPGRGDPTLPMPRHEQHAAKGARQDGHPLGHCPNRYRRCAR